MGRPEAAVSGARERVAHRDAISRTADRRRGRGTDWRAAVCGVGIVLVMAGPVDRASAQSAGEGASVPAEVARLPIALPSTTICADVAPGLATGGRLGRSAAGAGRVPSAAPTCPSPGDAGALRRWPAAAEARSAVGTGRRLARLRRFELRLVPPPPPCWVRTRATDCVASGT
jgi:hypothetical protein